MISERDIVIEVNGLKAGYGGQVVLRDISFQVRRGEVLVILGSSGSGKSTLLKHLIGLMPPLAGQVSIEGKDFVRASGADRLAILRRFGVMYQSGALFGSMTLLENVRLPLDEFTNLPAVGRNLAALGKLKQVGLIDAAHKFPAELSGGMRKRAAIARAMALDPGILFLDEPSAGLDPITSAGLDELIRRLSCDFGITFVVVTHELSSIYAISDRVIMLDSESRTIIAEGEPHDLRDHSPNRLVRQFFLRQAEPETVATEIA